MVERHFILKVVPDILPFTESLWQWAIPAATFCLPLYGYCIRGMNENAVVKWAPEGKISTNGALMKISSLLVNVEIYTNEQRKKLGLGACTHTQRCTCTENRWVCHITSLLCSLFISPPICQWMLSFTSITKKTNYSLSSSIFLYKYADKLDLP